MLNFTEDFQFTKYSPGQFYGWHTDSNPFPYRQFDPAVDKTRKNADGTDYIDMYGETIPEDLNTTGNPKLVGKIRKLSVTLSLNDPSEYSGGNLRFDLGPHRPDRYHTATEIRPKGSIVVFPSHVHHQVTPVTKGTRYSLVSWHLGAPFR
jgi:PKHD-type hydroxylase